MPAKGDETALSEGHRSWLGYAIAFVTLGAAIGNMFMAGKVRNVMKMEIPNPESWRPPRNNTQNAESTQSTHNATSHAHRTYQAPSNPTIPQHIVPHLTNLKLPLGSVSEAEIKSAYRKAVMQYHPDRIPLKDAELKPVYEAKFKQSTDSYHALIDFYVKQKD